MLRVDGTRRCDAEIKDLSAIEALPKGRLAWKGCIVASVRTVRSASVDGVFLDYCAQHLATRPHRGD